jgi:hypothetical protein
MQDQVALLTYPRRTISGEVASRIVASVDADAVEMQLRGPSDRWKLSELLAMQLIRARDKLDAWWYSDSLSNGERYYLIEHRADAEQPPHTVRLEPPIIRAYLEMKVHEPPPL